MNEEDYEPRRSCSFAPTAAFVKYFPDEVASQGAAMQQPTWAVGKMEVEAFVPPPPEPMVMKEALATPVPKDKQEMYDPRMASYAVPPPSPQQEKKVYSSKAACPCVVMDDILLPALGGVVILVAAYYAYQWWGASVPPPNPLL